MVGREMVSLEWPMVVRAEAKYSTRTDGVPFDMMRLRDVVLIRQTQETVGIQGEIKKERRPNTAKRLHNLFHTDISEPPTSTLSYTLDTIHDSVSATWT